ncbi:MAG: hypothetical protein WAZ27_00150 [Minisyncoccia bacterium]
MLRVIIVIFLAVVSEPGFTQAEISGTSDETLNCYWGMVGGTEAETGVKPLKEGAVCKVTQIANNPAFALECAGIEKPAITSTCKKGKCVATLGCDGKPLTGVPDIDTGDPLTPTPIPAPTPTAPTPAPVQLPAPTPVPTGSGSGSGSGSVPTDTLPPIIIITDPAATPKPGTGLNPGGPPYTLLPGAKPPSGSTGSGGVLDGTIPFPGDSNTTFPGSGWGSRSDIGANGFMNFISNVADILGSFFPLFSGGSSLSQDNSSVSRPGQNAPSAPVQIVRPLLQVAGGLDARTLSVLEGIEQGRPPVLPTGPLTERTGLDALMRELGSVPLTGGAPQDGGKLTVPLDALRNPDDPPVPVSRPIIVDIAELGQIKSDASPRVPEYVTVLGPRVEKEFITQVERGVTTQEAYARARSRSVEETFAGLESGTLPVGSEEVATTRRILEQNISIAKQTRDRAYLTSALPFQEWIDKTFGGILSSSYKRAVDAAEARLAELGDLEGNARIAALAGSLQPPPASLRPSIISVTNEPISEEGFRSIPTPLDVARTAYAWWTGPVAAPAPIPAVVPTPAAPIVPTTPSALPTPIVPPVSVPVPPQVEPEPSRMLDGLSAAAKRVYDGVNSAARRIGFSGGAQTPAPSGSVAQTPAGSTSGTDSGFLRAGLSLLSAFMQNFSNLFLNDSSSNNPSPAPLPTPSAAIVANPPTIDAGNTTKLSWTSTGALSCVVVDTELRLIAGDGTNGDVNSPALQKSTRFGVICDIAGGKDKFVNETLVRVRGDESDPGALFAQQGRISQSVSVDLPTVSATTTQDLDMQPPLDVRTCEPDQSMDTFIRCLCDAEPNPNGCSLVR